MEKRFYFSIALPHRKGELMEILSFNLDDNITEEEMIQVIEKEYRQWVKDNNMGGWEEIVLNKRKK